MMEPSNRRGDLGEGVWNKEEIPQIVWTTRYGMWNLYNFEDEIYIKREECKTWQNI
jgi:hypothetical protein